MYIASMSKYVDYHTYDTMVQLGIVFFFKHLYTNSDQLDPIATFL